MNPKSNRPCQGKTPFARCHANCPLSHENWEAGELHLLDDLISGRFHAPKEFFIQKVYTHAMTLNAHRESLATPQAFRETYDDVFTQLLADRIQERCGMSMMGPCEREERTKACY